MIAGYFVNRVERRGEEGPYSRSKSLVWAVIAVFTRPACQLISMRIKGDKPSSRVITSIPTVTNSRLITSLMTCKAA
jgi:hypothetical protein